jgi:hypothetical protein
MVGLSVSLIDWRMERLLIVGWMMMHLKGVAMRMILGKCEILVLLLLLLLLRMKKTLQILRFLRMSASCLLPLLLLTTQLFLLLTMQFLRVAVGWCEMRDRRGRGLMRMRRVRMRLSDVSLDPIVAIEFLHLDLCHCRVP